MIRPQASRLSLGAAVALGPLLALVAGAGAASCGASSSDARPNVLFVLVDTLRADRLSFYGYEKETAPFLAELAQRSVVFERAWSGSTWTAPAVASIFTGTLPPQHGVLTGFNAYGARGEVVTAIDLNRIPPVLQTIPEFFQAQGYHTFGIADNANIHEDGGFADGFGKFVGYDYQSAPVVNAKLSEWSNEIRSGDEPWFVYLHYMDTHGPYHKRAAYYDFDEAELEIEHSLAPPAVLEISGDPWIRRYEIRQLLFRAQVATTDEEATLWLDRIGAYLSAVYESEIRYLDDHLKEAFETLGVDDSTLVVFVSDHGEELGDHGSVGHEFQLYNELLHVPLLIQFPARPGSARPLGRISQDVSTIDLLPTLCEALGQPVPEHLPGISLLTYLDGRAPNERPIFGMRAREVSDQPTAFKDTVILGDEKLIVSSPDDLIELYDLARDPAETNNRAAEDPAAAQRLRALLKEYCDSLETWERQFVPIELDDEQRARIEELGYGGEE